MGIFFSGVVNPDRQSFERVGFRGNPDREKECLRHLSERHRPLLSTPGVQSLCVFSWSTSLLFHLPKALQCELNANCNTLNFTVL